MEQNVKTIKTVLQIDMVSSIDKIDDEKGEADINFAFKLDTNFPELAQGLAMFLKACDIDEDLQKISELEQPGKMLLELISNYYNFKGSE